MADEKQDSPENQPPKPPEPSVPPVDNNINSGKEKEEQPANTTNYDKPKCNSPQPFIVKMEKSEGWSRAEKISVAGIIISASLFVMTLRSFEKTSEAVKISEASLNHAIYKDSITAISDKKRGFVDSIRREQDSINGAITIKQTQKSLDAQLKSIQQTQKEFELESRAYLMVANTQIDTTAIKAPFNVNFDIVDMGKFPANIVYSKIGVAIDVDTTIEAVKSLLDEKNGWRIKISSETVSSGTRIGYSQPSKGFSDAQYYYFRTGKMSLYLFAEFKYISVGIGKKYLMKYGVRMTVIPLFNRLNFLALEYSDTEIK